MYTFYNLNNTQLSLLMGEVVLNSPHLMDYANSYGIKTYIVKEFCDGYVDYLKSIARTIEGINHKNFNAVWKRQYSFTTLIEYRKLWERKRIDEARGIKRYTV